MAKFSEADLCNEFTRYAESFGWEVHPEVGWWDLLLVATPNVKTLGVCVGDQVGVQAKLHANVNVLWQATRDDSRTNGPHYRAALVPSKKRFALQAFRHVAHDIRCLVFERNKPTSYSQRDPFEVWRNCLRRFDLRYRMKFDHPLWVPPYKVPEGGKASPQRVTPWKIRAVLFCLQYKDKMFTTRDLALAGIGWSYFEQFTEYSAKRAGRFKLYRFKKGVVTPDLKNPWLAEQIQEHLKKGGDPYAVHKLQT